MLPYQTLKPYFLKKVNFYLEKGIDKSENDTLPIKMVDELPQQAQCDYGAFVCTFAEYCIHGTDIPKDIDMGYIRMRIFKDVPYRDMGCWNAMIAGFCWNGNAMEALSLLDGMIHELQLGRTNYLVIQM
ncbi:hypothetical protein BC332_28381 [Capsicum chinense]|nr:hypothetical protein BC332_28381 [Capsicum chinense]